MAQEDGEGKKDARGGALGRMRARMKPEAVARADRIARIKRGYVTNPNDKALAEAFGAMQEGQAAFEADQPLAAEALKERALFVIGDSGSGKSTAIKRLLSRRPELESYVDGHGRKVDLAVSFGAPAPLTMKLLAKTGLAKIGYPIERYRQENEMWDLFRAQLTEREVLWLHIDEMQHAVKGSGQTQVKDIRNIVKNLLQLHDWPLNAIFSGVTGLAAFLQHEDGQVKNRCRVLRFGPVVRGSGTRTMQKVVEGVVTKHAEMQAEDAVMGEEFVNRLIHATSGAFGTAIQFTREAIFIAMRDGREKVVPRDFADFYIRCTGCLPDQNVFTAADWQSIDPGNAVKDLIAQFQEEEKAARKSGGGDGR